MKRLIALLFTAFCLLAISGCTETVIVEGEFQESKACSGYISDIYISDEYITCDEVELYQGKNIRVIGSTKIITMECDPYEQCREGTYEVFYDIESFEILE